MSREPRTQEKAILKHFISNDDILKSLANLSFSTSDQSTHQFTNFQATNTHSTNSQPTNDQLTNPHSTNNQSANCEPANSEPTSDQFTNDESSNGQSTNSQTTASTKTSEMFEISFSKKSDCGPSEILENFLFLGAGRDANDVPYIQKRGITYVLCMVSGWKPRVAYGDISVNFLHLPIGDTPLANISNLFPKAIEFIDSARNSNAKILVHCAAGISRSSTVVLAYLMKSHNMTLRQSFNLVHSKRSIIRPNNGFFDQLMEWEKTIYGSSTMTRKDLPFIMPRLPPTPTFTASKILEIEEGMAWAATVLTEEVLNGVFMEICGGEYAAEKTSDFLDKILLVTRNHPAVVEMQQKGYRWPKLSINLMKSASNWYKAKKN